MGPSTCDRHRRSRICQLASNDSDYVAGFVEKGRRIVPTYQYRCSHCGTDVEKTRPMPAIGHHMRAPQCPKCGQNRSDEGGSRDRGAGPNAAPSHHANRVTYRTTGRHKAVAVFGIGQRGPHWSSRSVLEVAVCPPSSAARARAVSPDRSSSSTVVASAASKLSASKTALWGSRARQRA